MIPNKTITRKELQKQIDMGKEFIVASFTRQTLIDNGVNDGTLTEEQVLSLTDEQLEAVAQQLAESLAYTDLDTELDEAIDALLNPPL